MSCSAYLESAAYNLERQSNAHSFDKSAQGSLATGIGRENVTGILPLYLFNEHWEIAKRTIPSIFGFMCTLDIMGYSDDQFYIIPFTVLFKCHEMMFENQNDINKKMFDVVSKTCIEIVKRHEKFRERILEKLNNFQKEPIYRTKDNIENFRVFFAQILTLINAGYIDKSSGFDWPKFIRFTVEECTRRLIPKGSEVPSKRAQADFLNLKKTESIVKEGLEIKGIDPNEKLDKNQMLDRLNNLASEKPSDSAEEAKLSAFIDDQVESMPWYDSLEKEGAEQCKSVKKFNSSIKKKMSYIRVFIDALGLENLPAPSSMNELSSFSNIVVTFAMLFQNTLHPSNK